MPDLVSQITKSQPADNTVRVGKVAAVSENALTVDVVVSGRTLPKIAVMSSYQPRVGDIVAVVRQQASWMVIGRPGSSGMPGDFSNATHITGIGANSVTSASFVTMAGGGNLPYYKKNISTKLQLRMEGTWFAVSAACGMAWGLNVSYSGTGTFATVDVEVVRHPQSNSALVSHTFVVGGVYAVHGGPIGLYTFVPRLRRIDGTGVVTTNADDRLSYYVEEVWN